VNFIEYSNSKKKGAAGLGSQDKVAYHVPEEPVYHTAEKIEQPPAQVADQQQAQKPKAKKIRLTFILIVVIIILAIGGFVFYYIYYFDKVISVNPDLTDNNITEQDLLNQSEVSVIQPELPDTEMAPLNGALVKFDGQPEVYLVDNHGDLRMIDRESVIFNSNKRLSQISPSLIYTINDKWQNTREGDIITGKVDFDPRIITYNELRLFIVD